MVCRTKADFRRNLLPLFHDPKNVTDMLITVIVPTYNMESLMREMLNSLLRQTFRDFELLLIDDGSTDSSGAICDEYAARDARVRVIHKPNEGPSSARNTGLNMARGRYVTFCDSDDWVDEDYLAQLLGSDMDDTTLPVTGLRKHYPDGKTPALTAPATDVRGARCRDAIDMLRRTDLLGFIPNKLLVRSIVEQHRLRFAEGLAHREDELFMQQYIRHIHRIRIDDRTPYHYRMVATSLTHRPKNPALLLEVAVRLRDGYSEFLTSAAERYLTQRIFFSQVCEALKAARTRDELAAMHAEALRAWDAYKSARDERYYADRRDRKVAHRSRWVFGLAERSPRLLRLLVKHIHI